MVQKCVVYKKIRKCQINLFSSKLQVLKWRHIHSQSLSFGVVVLQPTRSEISRFGTSKHGEGKSLLNRPYAKMAAFKLFFCSYSK